MEINEKQQEIIYKFSFLEQQIQQIQEQMQMIEKGVWDLNELIKGIENLKGKKDEEFLAHVGKGIFMKAKILSEDFIVDVGKRKFVKKNSEQAKEMIQKQIQRLNEMNQTLKNSFQETNNEMMRLIEEVQVEEKEN
jgi:prefoldin alpha subunit